MNTADYVDQLAKKMFDLVKDGTVSLSEAAFTVARACVGWPYVYGAWGAYCTPSERRKRYSYHPESTNIKAKCQVLRSGNPKPDCDGCQWYPDRFRTRCFDCRGFTDWVLKQFGIDLYGDTCGVQWNTKKNWLAQGTIDTCPDDVLVCLFRYKDGKFKHTGFGFRGQVCDCGTNVTYTAKRGNNWTHWAIPKGVTDKVPDINPDYRPTLRRGDKGAYVKLMQTELIGNGYDLSPYGADGDFGSKTEQAVKTFQKASGLVQDGICGQKTWAALENGTPKETYYTVTIPHLTKEKAAELKAQYSAATVAEER